MEWIDEAIVLSTKRYGETSLIANLMTSKHGKHAGLIRGGSNKRFRGLYQTGNEVQARWRSRLSEHLGVFNCELKKANAADFLEHPLKLAALSSACSVIEFALPEREVFHGTYLGLKILISSLKNENIWPIIYIKLELGLLKELGFGLDLLSCAATGSKQNLIYISPKSGRAVSEQAGKKYHKKLLKLPQFLLDTSLEVTQSDIHEALKITGFFLQQNNIGSEYRNFPPARLRFIQKLTQIDH